MLAQGSSTLPSIYIFINDFYIDLVAPWGDSPQICLYIRHSCLKESVKFKMSPLLSALNNEDVITLANCLLAVRCQL